ncbi:uncharacterized protein LOC144124210 [Amblyomma americanum]
MPDATNDDNGGARQPNSEITGEPRYALPTTVGSVASCSYRQLQDAHVTLLRPSSRPNTDDITTQLTGIISAATEPSAHSAGEEDGVSANAQLCTVSDELLSIYHHSESRREQVSKQLSADLCSWYDHIRAGRCLRLECEFRGCECEQLSTGSDVVADTMKNNRSTCSALGEWRTLYHLEREVRTQGSTLLSR